MKTLLFLLPLLVSCAHQNHQNKLARFDRMKAKEGTYPISNEIQDPAVVAEFRKVACKGVKAETCSERFLEMAHARFVTYYDGAKRADVDRVCTAYPAECQSLEFIEDAYASQHNATVEAMKRGATREFEMAQAEQQRQLSAWADQLHQQNLQHQQRQPASQQYIMPGAVQTQCQDVGGGRMNCQSWK
jgi:hypothetical protein